MSRELATDVVTEAACAAVLGDKAAQSPAARHLLSIHCTDQAKGTTHEKLLKLTFRMPAPGAGGGATAMEEALGGRACRILLATSSNAL